MRVQISSPDTGCCLLVTLGCTEPVCNHCGTSFLKQSCTAIGSLWSTCFPMHSTLWTTATQFIRQRRKGLSRTQANARWQPGEDISPLQMGHCQQNWGPELGEDLWAWWWPWRAAHPNSHTWSLKPELPLSRTKGNHGKIKACSPPSVSAALLHARLLLCSYSWCKSLKSSLSDSFSG